MKEGIRYSAEQLVPLEQRAVFVHGLVTKAHGRLVYNWEKIEQYWYADTDLSLTNFAAKWDIPYKTLVNQGRFSLDKKMQAQTAGSTGYTAQILRTVTSSRLRTVRDAQNLATSLAGLAQVAAMLGKYSEARLTKTRNGRDTVNVLLNPAEVKQIAAIARDAAECMATVLDLERLRVAMMGGDADKLPEVEVIVEQPDEPDQRAIPAVTQTKRSEPQ